MSAPALRARRLGPVDLLEHVGRQAADAVEFFHRLRSLAISAAGPASAGFVSRARLALSTVARRQRAERWSRTVRAARRTAALPAAAWPSCVAAGFGLAAGAAPAVRGRPQRRSPASCLLDLGQRASLPRAAAACRAPPDRLVRRRRPRRGAASGSRRRARFAVGDRSRIDARPRSRGRHVATPPACDELPTSCCRTAVSSPARRRLSGCDGEIDLQGSRQLIA